MKNNKIRYLLGIDGGGTKTEFVLSHINGNEIARVVLGCSNPVNIGTENACGNSYEIRRIHTRMKVSENNGI